MCMHSQENAPGGGCSRLVTILAASASLRVNTPLSVADNGERYSKREGGEGGGSLVKFARVTTRSRVRCTGDCVRDCMRAFEGEARARACDATFSTHGEERVVY